MRRRAVMPAAPFVDPDPYRVSMRRRARAEVALRKAQSELVELCAADASEGDRKIGDEIFVALERFRIRLAKPGK